MSSFTASGLRSEASKSETKSASASKVARAGPTPQNGSAILKGRPISSRNSLAKARVSSLSVCNFVEKYAFVGSHRITRPLSFTATSVVRSSGGANSRLGPARTLSANLAPMGFSCLILNSPSTPSSANSKRMWGCAPSFALAIESVN